MTKLTLKGLGEGHQDRHAFLPQDLCFALRQNVGIESEMVDLLQGRVPRTVFARHYFTPSLDYRQRCYVLWINYEGT
jgi:hypothetical protein